MFKRFYNRKVRRLAREALRTAASMYETGEFKWTQFHEFIDGTAYSSAHLARNDGDVDLVYSNGAGVREIGGVDRGTLRDEHGPWVPADAILAAATGGCALGGVSKASWIVTGKPAVTDGKGWRLRSDVEIEAEGLLIDYLFGKQGMSEEYDSKTLGVITSYNDHEVAPYDSELGGSDPAKGAQSLAKDMRAAAAAS